MDRKQKDNSGNCNQPNKRTAMKQRIADELVIHIFKEAPIEELRTEEEVEVLTEEEVKAEPEAIGNFQRDNTTTTTSAYALAQNCNATLESKDTEANVLKIRESSLREEESAANDSNDVQQSSESESDDDDEEEEEEDSGAESDDIEFKNLYCEITLNDTKSESNARALQEENSDPGDKTGIRKYPELDFERVWEICLEQKFVITDDDHNYTCSVCPFITKEEVNMKLHILDHIEIDEKDGTIQYNRNDSEDAEYYRISLLNQSDTKVFKCSVCDYESAKVRNLVTHIKMHKKTSEIPTLRCHICYYKTNDRRTLKNHFLTRHSNEQIFSCPECLYISTCKVALSTHLLVHSNNKLYKCDICNFESNRKRYMALHMAKHNTGSISYQDIAHEIKIQRDLDGLLVNEDPETVDTNSAPISDKKYPLYMPKASSGTIQCPECDYTTTRVNNFKNHVISHNEFKRFDCVKCSYKIDRKSRLINHLLEHHYNMKLIVCPMCEFKTNRTDNLNKHIVTHKNAGLRKCTKCNFRTSREDELTKHMEIHSSYRCFNCDFETERKTHLMEHMKIHRITKSDLLELSEGLFACGLCDYRCQDKVIMDEHLRLHNRENKAFKCTKCTFCTDYRDTFERHLTTHMDRKLYECPECDFRTNKKSRLSKHSLKHTGFEFKCMNCSFSSNDKIQFETHLLQLNHSPSSERLLYCSFCDFKTFRRNNLEVHSLIHNRVDDIRCPECSFSTKRRDHFKAHLLVHNDNNPRDCTKCDYTTTRRVRLLNHLLDHYKLKLFQCAQCHYKTNRTDALNSHLQKHNEEKLFECTECGYKTNLRSHLRKHIAQHVWFKCSECSFETYSDVKFKLHCLEHGPDDKAQVLSILQDMKVSNVRDNKKPKRKRSSTKSRVSKSLKQSSECATFEVSDQDQVVAFKNVTRGQISTVDSRNHGGSDRGQLVPVYSRQGVEVNTKVESNQTITCNISKQGSSTQLTKIEQNQIKRIKIEPDVNVDKAITDPQIVEEVTHDKCHETNFVESEISVVECPEPQIHEEKVVPQMSSYRNAVTLPNLVEKIIKVENEAGERAREQNDAIVSKEVAEGKIEKDQHAKEKYIIISKIPQTSDEEIKLRKTFLKKQQTKSSSQAEEGRRTDPKCNASVTIKSDKESVDPPKIPHRKPVTRASSGISKRKNRHERQDDDACSQPQKRIRSDQSKGSRVIRAPKKHIRSKK